MSRKGSKKSSLKTRSKMDRYTEDLRYSLRCSLADSVDRASLRADDILARSHRQIVADFTDPRQWYYSATHDYLIRMMRESQRQNVGGRGPRDFGSRGRPSGSRHQDSRLSLTSTATLTSMGRSRSSRASVHFALGDGPDRKREELIRIPTETSQDVQEIRGSMSRADPVAASSSTSPFEKDNEEGKHNGTTSRDTSQPSALSGSRSAGVILPSNPGMVSYSPELIGEQRVSADKSLNPSSFELNDQSKIIKSPTEDTHLKVLLHSNTEEELAKEPCDAQRERKGTSAIKSVRIQSTSKNGVAGNDFEFVAESSTPAMETYRTSKRIQQNYSPQNKVKSPQKSAMPSKDMQNFIPLPDISGPFIPIERRHTRPERDVKEAIVGFPYVGESPHAHVLLPHQTVAENAQRSTTGKGWKRRAGPKSTLDPMFGRKSDPKYVEDWVKKLQVKEFVRPSDGANKSVDPVGLDDVTSKVDTKEPIEVHSMSLPSDFQPLSSFQSFHPMTSLYIYSMKQKSNLNVKFNHFQIPRPLRLPDRSNTFEENLQEARARVNFIEDKLGELYAIENDLAQVVDRKTTKIALRTSRKPKDVVIEAKPILQIHRTKEETSHHIEADANRFDHPNQHQKEVASNEEVSADTARRADLVNPGASLLQANTNSKVSVVSISLPKEKSAILDDEVIVGEEDVATPQISGNDFHAPSTSSWKQTPIPFARSKEVKVLQGKMIRVFDDGSGKTSDGPERQLIRFDVSGDPKREDAIVSPESPGLGISDAAVEVIHELLDRLDSPDDATEPSMSLGVSESLSPYDVPDEAAVKTTNANTSPTAAAGTDDTTPQPPQASPIGKCIFCEAPH